MARYLAGYRLGSVSRAKTAGLDLRRGFSVSLAEGGGLTSVTRGSPSSSALSALVGDLMRSACGVGGSPAEAARLLLRTAEARSSAQAAVRMGLEDKEGQGGNHKLSEKPGTRRPCRRELLPGGNGWLNNLDLRAFCRLGFSGRAKRREREREKKRGNDCEHGQM